MTVIKDDELDKGFPDCYATVVEVKTRRRQAFNRATASPVAIPKRRCRMPTMRAKFDRLAGASRKPRVQALADCIPGLWKTRRYAASPAVRAGPDA